MCWHLSLRICSKKIDSSWEWLQLKEAFVSWWLSANTSFTLGTVGYYLKKAPRLAKGGGITSWHDAVLYGFGLIQISKRYLSCHYRRIGQWVGLKIDLKKKKKSYFHCFTSEKRNCENLEEKPDILWSQTKLWYVRKVHPFCSKVTCVTVKSSSHLYCQQ